MSDSITVEQYNRELACTMPERGRDGLQNEVRKMALDLGWLYYHPFWSQRSEPGFPDVLVIKGSRIVVMELKRQDKDPTPAQEEWLAAFAAAGIETHVFRPLDLLDGTIAAVLAAGEWR